jgi:hypothetical protein
VRVACKRTNALSRSWAFSDVSLPPTLGVCMFTFVSADVTKSPRAFGDVSVPRIFCRLHQEQVLLHALGVSQWGEHERFQKNEKNKSKFAMTKVGILNTTKKTEEERQQRLDSSKFQLSSFWILNCYFCFSGIWTHLQTNSKKDVKMNQTDAEKTGSRPTQQGVEWTMKITEENRW